jgi:hypothetical protein
MNSADKTLEVLAIAAHGAGTLLGLLALLFHLLRERTVLDRDVIIAAFCIWYHGNAVLKHGKRL